MKLIQLKCSSCGASLKIKKDVNKVKCDFCGITTIIDDEKIIVEHKIKDNEIDTLYDNAFIYLDKLEKYDKAKKIFLRLSEIKPGDPKIWEGIIRAETENFSNLYIDENGEEKVDLNMINNAYNNYCMLVDKSENEIEKDYEEYLDKIYKLLEVHDEEKKNYGNPFKYFILFAVVVLIFVFVCISIDENTEIEYKPSEEELIGEEFNDRFDYIRTVKCSYFNENIISFNLDSFFLDNKAYALNINQLYSNNQNCKEIEFDKDLTNEIFITSYNINDKEHNEEDALITANKNICDYEGDCYQLSYDSGAGKRGYNAYYQLQGLSKTFGFNILDQNSYKFHKLTNKEYWIDFSKRYESYHLLVNDKLYLVDYWAYGNTKDGQDYNIKYYEVELNLDEDEYIIDVGRYIKTNKAFYSVIKYKSNKEECEMYADVKCVYKYKLKKDKVLTYFYDDIYYIDEYLVMKSGSIYS